MDEELVNLATEVGNKLLAAGLSVTTAESCTSGCRFRAGGRQRQ